MFLRDRTSAEVAAQPFELLALLGFLPLYGPFPSTFSSDPWLPHCLGWFVFQNQHLTVFLDDSAVLVPI